MRLLVRRIYRVFPELDRYSDERCLRFVRTANRGWRRWRHAVLILLTAAAVFAVAVWVGDRATTTANGFQDRMRRDVWWATLAAWGVTSVFLAGVPLAGFLVRDRLLRGRITRILRAESCCPGCRYRLIGLAVSDQNTIMCPECGMVVAVDPALGELTISSSGAQEYKPSIIVPEPPPFWTRRRIRWAVRIVVVAILIPVVLCGWLMWWVDQQVNAAIAARPSIAASLVESRQPDGGGLGTANGWDELAAAQNAARVADQKAWGSRGYSYYARPLGVLIDPEVGLQKGEAEQLPEFAQAKRAMELYHKEGVYDRLRRMASCRRAVAPKARDWMLARVTAGWPGETSELANICEVRMELARRAGDLAEFADALESRLALARVLRQQVDGFSLELSASIETSTLASLTVQLAGHPTKEWLDLVDAAVGRQQTPLPTQNILEGERAGVTASICDAYVLLGAGPLPALNFVLGSLEVRSSGYRIGAFAENRDAVDAYFGQMEAFAGLPPFKRPSSPPLLQTGDLAIVAQLFPDESVLISGLDRNMLARRGFTALMALERYHQANGKYPGSLEELLPEFLNAMPEDPWSGKALGYVVVDPAKDSQGRSFLLYSVGNDRMDNKGWFWAQCERARLLDTSVSSGNSGSDYIINELPEKAP